MPDLVVLQALLRFVESRAADKHRPWWQAATTGAVDRDGFLAAFAGASRRLGRAPVTATPQEKSDLAALNLPWPRQTIDEIGRLALLLAAVARLTDATHPALVDELYRIGDLSEKCTVLRWLSHLPGPERFVTVAGEGVRSNAATILEAIACDNDYPQDHLPEDTWNQMVMKAVFNELPLSRVRGLQRRNNPELARIARDFAAERRAAGRPVPVDLALVQGDPNR